MKSMADVKDMHLILCQVVLVNPTSRLVRDDLAAMDSPPPSLPPAYSTARSSTSNVSVAPPGMTGGDPLSP